MVLAAPLVGGGGGSSTAFSPGSSAGRCRGRLDFGNLRKVRLAFGHLDEEVLRAERRQVGIAEADVGAIGAEQSRLDCVSEVSVKDLVTDAGADLRIAQGKTTSHRSKRLRGIQSALPQ